ncbi:MAG: DUF4286 family protein [Planctomycetota bacterium]
MNGSATLAYTVAVTFTDAAVADEWIAWIRSPHMADVVAAGAQTAMLVRIDSANAGSDAPIRCEVHYTFADRAAFAAYERDHAPRLRAEGLERFPTSRGITYHRSVGDVLAVDRGRG